MESHETISQIISRITKGPFVFMLMPFEAQNADWNQFRTVKETIKRAFNLPCITANDIPGSGYNLRDKIYAAIGRAELVIADVTSRNPNVMHEVGYASGKGKDPLLLVKDGVEVPTNLKGLESIPYGGAQDTSAAFPKKLKEHLRFRLTSDAALLKEMLEAEDRHPAYIVAAPKRNVPSAIQGHVWDHRTYGDNLGILGLISAFGLMWGEPRGVELISADFHAPGLPNKDLNLYLIGSGKVNDIIPKMLKRLQEGLQPQWELADKDGIAAPEGDAYIRLYRNENGMREQIEGKVGKRGRSGEEKEVFVEDYGIVIRGPHPDYPHRMVLILAGAHSCGTGAACLAATRSLFVREIREKLPEGTLADKRQPFWACVKGVLRNDEEGLLDIDGVKIVEAGVYTVK